MGGQTAGGIALAKADLTPTLLAPTTALPGGRQYALHPAMTGLAGLFNSGKAAISKVDHVQDPDLSMRHPP